jgi:hypothetical protein
MPNVQTPWSASYRLDYVGFPENLHAEMIVDVSYKAPDSKEFKVLSEIGSTWIVNHILKRLLKSEHEASEAANRERTRLNSQNYGPQYGGRLPIRSGGPAKDADQVRVPWSDLGECQGLSLSAESKLSRLRTHHFGSGKPRFIMPISKLEISGSPPTTEAFPHCARAVVPL